MRTFALESWLTSCLWGLALSVLEDLWHDHDLPGLLAVVVGGPVDDVEDEEEDGEEDEEEAVHLGVALALPPRHAVLVVVPREERIMLGLELRVRQSLYSTSCNQFIYNLCFNFKWDFKFPLEPNCLSQMLQR